MQQLIRQLVVLDVFSLTVFIM